MTNSAAHIKQESVGILVVDDHPNTANTLARALSQLGTFVHVTSATSGQEALSKVKNTPVDILITDMIMPEMTGLELIEKMQEHPGGKPSYTYLVTAYDVPGLKVTAQRLRVSEVILKPVRPERICQITMQAINEMRTATKPASKAPKRKFKILVADDMPDNVTLLARYLEYEGYDQVTATDGLEALNKVRDELPDLVLLDVNMPNKDGFSVLGEIRADPAVAHIPVIILTAARLDPSDVQSGLNLGADDYVTKPFDRHELMARIRTKLRVKETEDVIRRRNRELNLLPEIGKELSARLNVKDLANVLLKRTVETLGAVQGNMVLLENETEVRENYQVSMLAPEAGHELNLSPSLIEHIRDTRHGVVIEDVPGSPLWNKGVQTAFQSAVAAPLYGRRSLLGLLILTHEQGQYFNMDHLLLLQAIASQAAIAVENSALYANMAQNERRLTAVLNHVAEAIMLFDDQGRLTLLNPTAEKLFTDFKAKLHRRLPEGKGYDAFIQVLEEARKSRQAQSAEIAWPDMRTFTALVTPFEDGGQVVILHDVSRFKELEQVKNEFIATASHDLKNPIAAITGFSALLGQAGPLNPQQVEFVNRIQGAARNMNDLVVNLLSLAQMDLNTTRKQETVDVKALVEEVFNEFAPQAQEKNQRLRVKPLDQSVYVRGDSLQLSQLLRNLIANAIKYTPEGGIITVDAAAHEKLVALSVADTGVGIPAADLPLIFNRFYRARNGNADRIEGNGLGLAIVKSIVEQHGGDVRVTSEIGQGSCFTITLPRILGQTRSINALNSLSIDVQPKDG
jgi:signal transduction histidine kinase/DNA-binding response OmpR family regulator